MVNLLLWRTLSWACSVCHWALLAQVMPHPLANHTELPRALCSLHPALAWVMLGSVPQRGASGMGCDNGAAVCGQKSLSPCDLGQKDLGRSDRGQKCPCEP